MHDRVESPFSDCDLLLKCKAVVNKLRTFYMQALMVYRRAFAGRFRYLDALSKTNAATMLDSRRRPNIAVKSDRRRGIAEDTEMINIWQYLWLHFLSTLICCSGSVIRLWAA